MQPHSNQTRSSNPTLSDVGVKRDSKGRFTENTIKETSNSAESVAGPGYEREEPFGEPALKTGLFVLRKSICWYVSLYLQVP